MPELAIFPKIAANAPWHAPRLAEGMQAVAKTMSLGGLDARPVSVEVDSGRGPTCFHLVGLAETSVRESRVRVRAALGELGVFLDEYVLTVNLAPADMRKHGGSYDLAIALGAMAALEELPGESLGAVALLGELSLSGELRPVRGVLPRLVEAARAGLHRAIVPYENGGEAALVPGIQAYVARTLEEAAEFLRGRRELPLARRGPPVAARAIADIGEIRGQPVAKRGMEIAAAGGHNLLLVGPPGSGKTMLARRLPGLLPPLDDRSALEVTKIHSVAGTLPTTVGLVTERPFRAPHHSASQVGLIGGGDPVRPGEVSLAHLGCLFLDEFLEFRRGALESLRQPLEDGHVTVCRARGRFTFPAQPTLIAALNPCPCGYAGHPRRACVCAPFAVERYRSALSGPLLDRIDVQLVVPPVELGELTQRAPSESSMSIRERVIRARDVQRERKARGEVHADLNAKLGLAELEKVGAPDAQGQAILKQAMDRLALSARAYTKILRVARTLADLQGATAIGAAHVAEAVQARMMDRRDPARAPRAKRAS